MIESYKHSPISHCGCASCADIIGEGLSRRDFVRVLVASAASLAVAPLLPSTAWADVKPSYQAMLLSCIDPRTQAPVAAWMAQPQSDSHLMSLTGLYSQFTIAGASAAVVAPAFKAWRIAFWDNLGATIQLHKINTLVVVDHGDCGAFGIAYGQDVLADPDVELKKHIETTTALQKEIAAQHPNLNYQAHYIHRDAQGAFTQWKTLVSGHVVA
jgi:carbonic anhydrase